MKTNRFPLTLLLSLSITCVAVASAYAQGFQAVYSKDGSDVWAVGDAGKIYRSFDGGVTYTQRTLGARTLRGVAQQGLTVVIVSDSGKVWRSVNNGGAFALQVITGTPNLRALSMPAPAAGYAVGDGGTILKSTDGGASWSPQTSGTGAQLNAVAFTDANNGWAAGGGGTLLQTTNGGTSWIPVALSTTNALYTVAQNGSNVWAGGADGTCLRSTNGGAGWSAVDLKADARPDVRAISLGASNTVYVAGGGGFVRKSTDGGATWTFMKHDLHGQISAVYFSSANSGWAVNSKNLGLIRTANGGGTWSLPTGTAVQYYWSQKLSSGPTRGASVSYNWADKQTLYCMFGPSVYSSHDEGESWQLIANAPNINRVNAFVVSARDSNTWLAAATTNGGARQVIRTEDHGANWTVVLNHSFGEYGIPLEQHPDKPDTLLFGGDSDVLYRSLDRGKTWSPYGTKSFRSPCDIIIVPDSNAVVQVGDGITSSGIGDLWQSTDFGQSFVFKQSANGSEIPGMSCGRLANGRSYATTWSASGMRRTTDFGATWPTIGDSVGGVSSGWGTDVGRDDPNVAILGVYSGGNSYLTLDGGSTFKKRPLTGTNYSFFIRDRGLILAEQGNGIYKLNTNYLYTPSSAQAIALTAPNGGESWDAGTVHNVTWNATNIGLAHLEYRRSATDPWVPIADVEGYLGTYAWTVPDDPTTTAEVRVSDGWDATPIDVSNGVFTILSTHVVALSSPNGGEAWKYNTVHPISWSSTGVAEVGIDYRLAPTAPWVLIADHVSGPGGTYPWTIPNAPSSVASVRVRDLSSSVQDVSSTTFEITVPNLAAKSPIDFGDVEINTVASDAFPMDNTGTAFLAVLNVTTNNSKFVPHRTAFTVGAGASDTLGISFSPTAVGPDSAVVTVSTDDPYTPHTVLVRGNGVHTVGAGGRTPTAFALLQNQPNPFTGRTLIRYALPVRTDVRLEVFSLRGERIATLAEGVQDAGEYAVPFTSRSLAAGNGRSSVPSGVYFYRLRAGSFSATKRLLLMR